MVAPFVANSDNFWPIVATTDQYWIYYDGETMSDGELTIHNHVLDGETLLFREVTSIHMYHVLTKPYCAETL